MSSPPDAMRALAPAIDRVEVVSIPMAVRFRGIEHRESVLLHGPEGWGEFSPFLEYSDHESAAWLACAIESASFVRPEPQRSRVPINATIPVVDAERAHAIARSFGAGTAKVKVADARVSHHDDCARLEAVRDALGPHARIRVDANAAWQREEAVQRIRELDAAAGGLEYVEQPCASVDDLAWVRKRVNVPIAADESVRRAEDPLAVARAGAADVLVMKVQPLGGISPTLRIAEKAGLPVVVSSALETSVGLSAGLALAAALPELPYACGLGTARLLTSDVVTSPLPSADGALPVVRPDISEELLAENAADAPTTAHWLRRLERCAQLLRARGGLTTG